MFEFLKEDAIRTIITRYKLNAMKTDEESRYFVYCLQLSDNHIYVGSTDNIYRRLYEHFTLSKGSSIWVKLHSPIQQVLEILEDCGKEDETEKTLFYMNMFGFEKVRGGYYCKTSYINKPKAFLNYEPKSIIGKNLSRDAIDKIVKDTHKIINLDLINDYNNQEESELQIEDSEIQLRQDIERGSPTPIQSDSSRLSFRVNRW